MRGAELFTVRVKCEVMRQRRECRAQRMCSSVEEGEVMETDIILWAEIARTTGMER